MSSPTPDALVRMIVTEEGKAMTASMLRGRFDKAREAAKIPKADFQFRDLRAKAGTDKAESSGDILKARDQLGHTTVVMTEQYIRDRKGKKITPTRRIAENSCFCGNPLRPPFSWKPRSYWCPKPDSNRHALASERF